MYENIIFLQNHMEKDIGSIIGYYYPKYKEYAMDHNLLTLGHIMKLNKGDKIKLAIFSFNYNEWEEFVYTFDKMEDPIPVNKSWVRKMIFGESEYTKDIPLWIPKYRNHVRFSVQATKSPVFIADFSI